MCRWSIRINRTSDSMWFIELGTICVTVAVVVRVWWLVVQVLRGA